MESPKVGGKVGDADAHQFERDHSGKLSCDLCRNYWSPLDQITSKHQICGRCGIGLHTSCRPLAASCLPCQPKSGTSELADLSPDVHRGRLYVRIQHAYDLNAPAGTMLYAVVKLKHGNQMMRTATAESGCNECLWDANPDLPAHKSALQFQVSEGRVRADFLSDMSVEVEVWSTFLGIFDNSVSSCVIPLLPVLLYPQNSMERWFALKNVSASEDAIPEGKVLVSLLFEPLTSTPVKVHNPNPNTPTNTTPRTELTNGGAAGEGETYTPRRLFGDASARSSSAPVAVAAPVAVPTVHEGAGTETEGEEGTENTGTEESEAEDEGVYCEAKSDDMCAQGVTEDSQGSAEESTEAEAETQAETRTETTEVEAQAETDGTTADIFLENDAASAFYQSIADFTSKTTSSIGTFLFEMEALDTDADDPPPPPQPEEGLGVGVVHLHLVSVFKSKVLDAADGDHYVLLRVEDSKREYRTKTVYSSATPIFNVRWSVKIPHFRSAVVLSLMDAHSNRSLASARLSCYQLMQRDADRGEVGVENVPLLSAQEQEVGYATCRATFDEDVQGLFQGPLHDAPQPPREELSVQRLSAHIARFTAIFEVINVWLGEYDHLMSWRDPLTTALVASLFLYCTLYVSAEHALSCVVFVPLALLTRSYLRRKDGYIRYYVEKGLKTPKREYRPIAKIHLSVVGFRNLRVRGERSDRRHASPPALRVTYCPIEGGGGGGGSGGSGGHEFTVGYFGSAPKGLGFSVPEESVSEMVSNMVGVVGAEVPRDCVLQNVYDHWACDSENPYMPQNTKMNNYDNYVPSETPEVSLLYPVLQPLTAKVREGKDEKGGKEKGEKDMKGEKEKGGGEKEKEKGSKSLYLPWELNEGTIKLTLIDNQSSFVEAAEQCAVVRIKDIVGEGKRSIKDMGEGGSYEVQKWYPVRQPTIKTDSHADLDSFAYDAASSIFMSTASSDKTPSTGKEEGKKPKHAEVFVRIRLEVGVLDPTPEERENSWVLQGLLREEKKASSTISTLWNMPDNVVYVQNLMAWLLDLIESSKNILNWTSPRRTKPIYLAVVAIWAVTLLVPGRLLILLLGMYQFLFAFLPIPEGRSNMIRVGNLLASIANDDDLSRVYEAQRKQCAEAQAQQWQALKLARKVGLVLPVRWCGAVSIKGARSQGGPMPSGFVSVYMLLQGGRLVWWRSQEALQSKEASGQLLLGGQGGLTQVSPVDIRECGGRGDGLVAVFGQDFIGRPQKLTILCDDAETKAALCGLIQGLNT